MQLPLLLFPTRFSCSSRSQSRAASFLLWAPSAAASTRTSSRSRCQPGSLCLQEPEVVSHQDGLALTAPLLGRAPSSYKPAQLLVSRVLSSLRHRKTHMEKSFQVPGRVSYQQLHKASSLFLLASVQLVSVLVGLCIAPAATQLHPQHTHGLPQPSKPSPRAW